MALTLLQKLAELGCIFVKTLNQRCSVQLLTAKANVRRHIGKLKGTIKKNSLNQTKIEGSTHLNQLT